MRELREARAHLERSIGTPSEQDAIDRYVESIGLLMLVGTDRDVRREGISLTGAALFEIETQEPGAPGLHPPDIGAGGLRERLQELGFDAPTTERVLSRFWLRMRRSAMRSSGLVSGSSSGAEVAFDPGLVQKEDELPWLLFRAKELTRGQAPDSRDLLTVLFEPNLRSALVLSLLNVAPDFLDSSAVDHIDRVAQRDLLERVTNGARDEARQLGDRVVGSEHVLIGLLRESQTWAAAELTRRGASLERTRATVRDLRSSLE